MHVEASPLERWFTAHPGPYRHFLAGAGPAPWDGRLPAGPLPDVAFDWAYGTPEGAPTLRALVAAEEGLPDPGHVVLTLGASEANFLALVSMLQLGDEVVVQLPSYPQLACVAAATGAKVVPWPMPPGGPAAVDLAALPRLLTPRTRLVVVNAPHNPTGRTLSPEELWALVGAVRGHEQAMLLVDEVYRGVGAAEPGPGVMATVGPSRVLVTGSASKAWGLPGARVGWLLGEPSALEAVVRWREHSGLALASPAAAWLEALWPQRDAMEAANRRLLGRNMALLDCWLAAHPEIAAQVSPTAAVCLVSRREGCLDDVALAEWLYERQGLLVVPGATLGYAGWLRVGIGHRSAEELLAALDVLAGALRDA